MKSPVIILDFYGTLVHIPEPVDPYKRLYEEHLTDELSFDDFRRLVLTNTIHSVQELGDRCGIQDARFAEWDAELEAEIGRITAYEDSLDVVRQLSEHHELYLLSNLSTPYIRPFSALGFDKWIGKGFFSSEIGEMKPDPAAYAFVLKAIDKPASTCVMVGDSLKDDVEGATSAGIQSVWLRREEAAQPGTIGSLRELPDFIAGMSNTD